MMDMLVEKIIWFMLKFYRLAEVPKATQLIGVAVTAHINANARVDIMESLTEMVSQKDVKHKLKQLVRACHTHFDHRDHIAHSAWVFDRDGNPLAAKFRARGKVKSAHRSMSSGLLRQWADEAEKAMYELNGFHQWQRDNAFRERDEEYPQQGSPL